MELMSKKLCYDTSYQIGYDVVLANNDVISFLKDVPDQSVTLIVTSPPYNIGKEYEKRTELERYLKWQEKVITECKRILSSDGSICWQIGNHIKNREVFPLDVYFYQIFKKLDFKLRNRIIWHFGHGLHAKKRFSGRYEVILWFTKTDDYKFNLDPVRIPQKYPGKRSYKGENKGKPSGNPLGKNPSDIWEIIAKDWENEIWNIPNVKSNHPEKTIHPCQYPIELVERLVLALSDEKDCVFDPFTGVGSTLIAGILHNRQVVGVDKEKEYLDIAFTRIQEALKGTLKKRPLGKSVHQPKGTEKVSLRPIEWFVKNKENNDN
ncbi:MAG: DNA-methyltransferase [Candidatus Hodarchaeales archaeon]